jgi:hypothetical protein
MNVKRLVLAGVVAAVLFLVLDMVFGMAGGWIVAQISGQPIGQPAGIEAKVGLGLLFELINGFILAAIYAVIHPCLPGRGWVKGLSYGFLVWALRVVMWAFSTYMMTELSPLLIVVTVVTGLIEVLVLGVAIAAVYGGERS